MAEKHAKTDRSDTEKDTDAGGGSFQSHSRHKKVNMTSIYGTDSDEEAIV